MDKITTKRPSVQAKTSALDSRTLVLYPYSHEDYLRDNSFVEKAMKANKGNRKTKLNEYGGFGISSIFVE